MKYLNMMNARRDIYSHCCHEYVVNVFYYIHPPWIFFNNTTIGHIWNKFGMMDNKINMVKIANNNEDSLVL